MFIQTVVAQWHQCVIVNATVMGSIRTRRDEMFDIFISSLWQQGKGSAIQHTMPQGVEWSVLTLRSLCLPSYILIFNICSRRMPEQDLRARDGSIIQGGS